MSKRVHNFKEILSSLLQDSANVPLKWYKDQEQGLAVSHGVYNAGSGLFHFSRVMIDERIDSYRGLLHYLSVAPNTLGKHPVRMSSHLDTGSHSAIWPSRCTVHKTKVRCGLLLQSSSDGLVWTTLRRQTTFSENCWTVSEGNTGFRYLRILAPATDFEEEQCLFPGRDWDLDGVFISLRPDRPLLPEGTCVDVSRLVRKSDFDKNGLFYSLGGGFSDRWENPHLTGVVKVTHSDHPESLLLGSGCNIFERKGTDTLTRDSPDAWIAVDLTRLRRMCITGVTLRHGLKDESNFLRNWNLEGSADGKRWDVIRTHTEDLSLSGKGFPSASWDIESKVFYRCFRIFQTGPNSDGNDSLALSGLELYGTLYELHVLEKVRDNEQSTDTKTVVRPPPLRRRDTAHLHTPSQALLKFMSPSSPLMFSPPSPKNYDRSGARSAPPGTLPALAGVRSPPTQPPQNFGTVTWSAASFAARGRTLDPVRESRALEPTPEKRPRLPPKRQPSMAWGESSDTRGVSDVPWAALRPCSPAAGAGQKQVFLKLKPLTVAPSPLLPNVELRLLHSTNRPTRSDTDTALAVKLALRAQFRIEAAEVPADVLLASVEALWTRMLRTEMSNVTAALLRFTPRLKQCVVPYLHKVPELADKGSVATPMSLWRGSATVLCCCARRASAMQAVVHRHDAVKAITAACLKWLPIHFARDVRHAMMLKNAEMLGQFRAAVLHHAQALRPRLAFTVARPAGKLLGNAVVVWGLALEPRRKYQRRVLAARTLAAAAARKVNRSKYCVDHQVKWSVARYIVAQGVNGALTVIGKMKRKGMHWCNPRFQPVPLPGASQTRFAPAPQYQGRPNAEGASPVSPVTLDPTTPGAGLLRGYTPGSRYRYSRTSSSAGSRSGPQPQPAQLQQNFSSETMRLAGTSIEELELGLRLLSERIQEKGLTLDVLSAPTEELDGKIAVYVAMTPVGGLPWPEPKSRGQSRSGSRTQSRGQSRGLSSRGYDYMAMSGSTPSRRSSRNIVRIGSRGELLGSSSRGGETTMFDFDPSWAKADPPDLTGEGSALHLLVASNTASIDALGVLVDSGLDVNAVNRQGCTPLHLGAANPEIVCALLDLGADPTIKDMDGLAPMHVASWLGCLESVELLCYDPRVDGFAVNLLGLTALHVAALNGHAEICKVLADQFPLTLCQKSNEGDMPLHLAASAGRRRAMLALIECGADLRAVNGDGQTPEQLFDAAVANGFEDNDDDDDALLDDDDEDLGRKEAPADEAKVTRSDSFIKNLLHVPKTPEPEPDKRGGVLLNFVAALMKACERGDQDGIHAILSATSATHPQLAQAGVATPALQVETGYEKKMFGDNVMSPGTAPATMNCMWSTANRYEESEDLALKEAAAQAIQAGTRGMAGRKRAARVRAGTDSPAPKPAINIKANRLVPYGIKSLYSHDEVAELERAALKIQRRARGMLGRKRARAVRSGFIEAAPKPLFNPKGSRLKRLSISPYEVARVTEVEQAALKIQRRARGISGRQRAQGIKSGAITPEPKKRRLKKSKSGIKSSSKATGKPPLVPARTGGGYDLQPRGIKKQHSVEFPTSPPANAWQIPHPPAHGIPEIGSPPLGTARTAQASTKPPAAPPPAPQPPRPPAPATEAAPPALPDEEVTMVARVDGEGNSLLHLVLMADAAPETIVLAVDALAQAGADVNWRNNQGFTPLHCAVDTPVVVPLLLAFKADPNIPDDQGLTPLHCAAWQGVSWAVEVLTADNRTNRGAQDNEGLTPLHAGVLGGDRSVLLPLVAACSEYIETPTLEGLTALHCAVETGSKRSVLALLSAGADPLARDSFDRSCIAVAEEQNDAQLATLLAEAVAEETGELETAYLDSTRVYPPLPKNRFQHEVDRANAALVAQVAALRHELEVARPLMQRERELQAFSVLYPVFQRLYDRLWFKLHSRAASVLQKYIHRAFAHGWYREHLEQQEAMREKSWGVVNALRLFRKKPDPTLSLPTVVRRNSQSVSR